MRHLKSPLDIIHATAPNWVSILSAADEGNSIEVVTTPTLDGGLVGASYALTIRNEDGSIAVLETSPGTAVPASCPERHINRSGTFCIGLDAGRNITDHESAWQWWIWLEEFLKCQQWAAKYRRWPPGRWLSHGDAGTDHLAMEKIAQELGWEEEVRSAIEYKEGWLAGDLPRHRKKSEMLVNQRLPCPRGCLKHKGKREYATLRKDCMHRHQVSMLIKHENSRRKKEKEFVIDLLKKGFSCCGAMNDCPFAIQNTGD